MFKQHFFLLVFCLSFTAAITHAEQKELSLGYVYTANPALAYPEGDENKGILIDIATEIGKRSGVTFQPEKRYQHLISDEIHNGQLDAAIAGIYRNEKKDRSFLYSDSFLDDKVINSYRAQGLKKNTAQGYGDPITGVIAGGINLLERTFHDDYNSECENVESGKVTFEDLHGNPPTDPCDRNKSYIGVNIFRSGYFDHIFHKGVRDIDFYLVLRSEHENLLPEINAAIASMKEDGTVDRLFQQYVEKKKKKGNDVAE